MEEKMYLVKVERAPHQKKPRGLHLRKIAIDEVRSGLHSQVRTVLVDYVNNM